MSDTAKEQVCTVIDFRGGTVISLLPPYFRRGEWHIVGIYKVAYREYLLVWEQNDDPR